MISKIHEIGFNMKYLKTFIEKFLNIAKTTFSETEPKQPTAIKNFLVVTYFENLIKNPLS